jgi:hypothetical protein
MYQILEIKCEGDWIQAAQVGFCEDGSLVAYVYRLSHQKDGRLLSFSENFLLKS